MFSLSDSEEKKKRAAERFEKKKRALERKSARRRDKKKGRKRLATDPMECIIQLLSGEAKDSALNPSVFNDFVALLVLEYCGGTECRVLLHHKVLDAAGHRVATLSRTGIPFEYVLMAKKPLAAIQKCRVSGRHIAVAFSSAVADGLSLNCAFLSQDYCWVQASGVRLPSERRHSQWGTSYRKHRFHRGLLADTGTALFYVALNFGNGKPARALFQLDPSGDSDESHASGWSQELTGAENLRALDVWSQSEAQVCVASFVLSGRSQHLREMQVDTFTFNGGDAKQCFATFSCDGGDDDFWFGVESHRDTRRKSVGSYVTDDFVVCMVQTNRSTVSSTRPFVLLYTKKTSAKSLRKFSADWNKEWYNFVQENVRLLDESAWLSFYLDFTQKCYVAVGRTLVVTLPLQSGSRLPVLSRALWRISEAPPALAKLTGDVRANYSYSAQCLNLLAKVGASAVFNHEFICAIPSKVACTAPKPLPTETHMTQ